MTSVHAEALSPKSIRDASPGRLRTSSAGGRAHRESEPIPGRTRGRFASRSSSTITTDDLEAIIEFEVCVACRLPAHRPTCRKTGP